MTYGEPHPGPGQRSCLDMAFPLGRLCRGWGHPFDPGGGAGGGSPLTTARVIALFQEGLVGR